ncbi:unnamed protein product, partial [Effrenium voratum]
RNPPPFCKNEQDRQPKSLGKDHTPLAVSAWGVFRCSPPAFPGAPNRAKPRRPEAFAALPAFLEPGLTQKAVEMSQTLGQAPIQAPELSSSVALADLSPLENPNITFVVLLSMFSMSIAMVVWGRNGF